MKNTSPDNHIPRVLSQHAEQAPFLWHRRELLANNAATSACCTLYDLVRLDKQLDAHLEGLELAGSAGWSRCKERLIYDGAKTLFALAKIAFKHNRAEWVSFVLDQAVNNEEMAGAIISALSWLSCDKSEPHIQRMLAESSPELRRIGIAASANHRIDPGQPLFDALASNNHRLRARALKAVGELGKMDLLSQAKASFDHEDNECRFYYAWSATILGDVESVAELKSLALVPSFQHREEAAKIALKKMNVVEARNWQRQLAQTPDTLRLAIISAGIIGVPELVSWLIAQMANPILARVAGDAFSMITGIVITQEFEEQQPTGPTDDIDNGMAETDPDHGLPWPNQNLLNVWWERNRSAFNVNTRYLLGNPITTDNLQQILKNGHQRQRHAAALELAIMQPDHPLFNVRAPGFRQKRLLEIR